MTFDIALIISSFTHSFVSHFNQIRRIFFNKYLISDVFISNLKEQFCELKQSDTGGRTKGVKVHRSGYNMSKAVTLKGDCVVTVLS